MGSALDLSKNVFTFATSSVDVGSDVINSLDFLGYNISSAFFIQRISDHVLPFNKSEIGNSTDIVYPLNPTTTYRIDQTTTSSKPSESYTVDQIWGNQTTASNYQNDTDANVHLIWGILGIIIIFLPGLMSGLPFVGMMIMRRKLGWALLWLLMSFTFPLSFLAIQVLGIFNCVPRFKNQEKYAVLRSLLNGAEASIESSLQLSLQIYTILNGHHFIFASFQTISMVMSFIQITRCAIQQDMIQFKKVELGFKELLIETATRLPCYVTTVIFRTSAFTLTVVFLRLWAIIPISVLIIELAIIGYVRVKKRSLEDDKEIAVPVYFLTISNVGVLNTYNVGSMVLKQPDCDIKDVKTYVRNSSIASFATYFVTLTVVMFLAFYNPTSLSHWQEDRFLLKKGHPHFFSAFLFVFLMGCYSLTATLYRADEIANMNHHDHHFHCSRNKAEKQNERNSIKISLYENI